MLDDLLTQLIAAAADALVGRVDGAVASHEDMRAKRDGYRTELAAAAQNVGDKIAEAVTEECRIRYQSWLDHPWLGHGALVDEGRLADKNFVALVAAHQASPSPTLLIDGTLATIRVSAITRVVGEECIYAPPARRPAKAGAGKKIDKRKSRRPITLGDIGIILRPTVARLAGDEHVRTQAVAELKAAVLADKTGIAAKVHALATTPAYRSEIDALARAAADKLVEAAPPAIPMSCDKTTEVAPSIVFIPTTLPTPSVAEDEVAPPSESNFMNSVEVDSVTPNLGAPGQEAQGLDPADQQSANAMYEFLRDRRGRWALEQRGAEFAIKALKHREDINTVFQRIGHLSVVQAELRAIHNSPKE